MGRRAAEEVGEAEGFDASDRRFLSSSAVAPASAAVFHALSVSRPTACQPAASGGGACSFRACAASPLPDGVPDDVRASSSPQSTEEAPLSQLSRRGAEAAPAGDAVGEPQLGEVSIWLSPAMRATPRNARPGRDEQQSRPARA